MYTNNAIKCWSKNTLQKINQCLQPKGNDDIFLSLVQTSQYPTQSEDRRIDGGQIFALHNKMGNINSVLLYISSIEVNGLSIS